MTIARSDPHPVSFGDGWRAFKTQAIRPGTDPAAVDDLRRAFYAGAVHLYGLLHADVTGDPDAVEDELAIHLAGATL